MTQVLVSCPGPIHGRIVGCTPCLKFIISGPARTFYIWTTDTGSTDPHDPNRLFPSLVCFMHLFVASRAALCASVALTAKPLWRDHVRCISRSLAASFPTNNLALNQTKESDSPIHADSVKPGHAVISTFDLFSIGGEPCAAPPT